MTTLLVCLALGGPFAQTPDALPGEGEADPRIVDVGPYGISRNPMYVGLSVAYLGFSIVENTPWPPVLLPPVLRTLWVAVIRREERYLTEAFGTAYTDYCSRVRRWL